MHFKTLGIWLIIILISLALVVTGLGLNFSNFSSDKKSEKIKIMNYHLDVTDVSKITDYIRSMKPDLYNIDNVDEKLNILLKNNILFNIFIHKKNFVVSKTELTDTILNIHDFKSEGKFSSRLYKKFLMENNISEFSFQNLLKEVSFKTQMKNGLRLIIDNYVSKKLNYLYYTFKFSKNEGRICNDQTTLLNKFNKIYFSSKRNYLTSVKDVSYIDLSIENFFEKKKINVTNLNKQDFVYTNLVSRLNMVIFYFKNVHKFKKKRVILSSEELDLILRNRNKNMQNIILNYSKFIRTDFKDNLYVIKNDYFIKNILNKSFKNTCLLDIIKLKKIVSNKLLLDNKQFPLFCKKTITLIPEELIKLNLNKLEPILYLNDYIFYDFVTKYKFINTNTFHNNFIDYIALFNFEKKILKCILKVKNFATYKNVNFYNNLYIKHFPDFYFKYMGCAFDAFFLRTFNNYYIILSRIYDKNFLILNYYNIKNSLLNRN